MSTPTRLIQTAGAWLLALVLVGMVGARPAAAQELGVRCMNPDTGYTVGVPVDWFYNTHVAAEDPVADIAACRGFSPSDFTLTPGSEPSGIAIFISQQTGEIDTGAGTATTVDGRNAVVYETADADPSYIYEIDLPGDQMLVALTSSEWVGSYAENQEYLDAMMGSLAFVAPSARLGGEDRFGTAAEVSAANFAAGQDVAYVATGMHFPDALAGSAIAGIDGSPILLVTRDAIPSVTADELQRLAPNRIVVFGGPDVVSNSVAASLATYATSGDVDRLWGDDRYETAAAISASRFGSGVARAYIALGEDFPDALSGGALAGSVDGPLLLVERDEIPAATANELDRLGAADIVVFGGPEAISNDVAAALDGYTSGEVIRLWGDDRYGTAAAISQWNHDPGIDAVYITTGTVFPDALSSGPAAVSDGAPVLLVQPDAVPEETADELERLSPARVIVAGGPDAVSEAVRVQVATLARP